QHTADRNAAITYANDARAPFRQVECSWMMFLLRNKCQITRDAVVVKCKLIPDDPFLLLMLTPKYHAAFKRVKLLVATGNFPHQRSKRNEKLTCLSRTKRIIVKNQSFGALMCITLF